MAPMTYHMPHLAPGGKCNGEDVILSNGETIPCQDGLKLRSQPGLRTVRDPWQDPANWPDAPAINCPIYHGDACEGVHQ